MKKLMFAALLLSQSAFADLLTLTPGTTQIKGVTISTGAVAAYETYSYNLTTVGSGLRRSPSILGMVDVYVAEVLVADAATYDKTSAAGVLASVPGQAAVAFRLTFVRDVPGETMSEKFYASLDKNGYGADADVDTFLNLVADSGSAKNGGSLTLLFHKNAEGKDVLVYANEYKGQSLGGGTIVATGADLTKKILSIWFGVPSDDGVKALQAELLK